MNKKAILLLALLLALGFYWFALRPAMIRKQCAMEAGALELEGLKMLDQLIFIVPKEMTKYEYCLRRNGL